MTLDKEQKKSYGWKLSFICQEVVLLYAKSIIAFFHVLITVADVLILGGLLVQGRSQPLYRATHLMMVISPFGPAAGNPISDIFLHFLDFLCRPYK